MASIASLPVELVSDIFTKACQGFFDSGTLLPSVKDDSLFFQTALWLSSVSASWREIALATPQLWSSIVFELNGEHDVDFDVDILQMRLERSRNFPLHLTFEKSNSKSPSLSHVQDIWDTAVPHLSRCWRLSFLNISATYFTFLFPLPGVLKSLHWLDIHARPKKRSSVPTIEQIFNAEQSICAPSLKRFAMSGAHCPPTAVMNISHLRVVFGSNMPFTYSNLRGFIERNPTLETLVMASSESSDSDGDPITLPQLKYLGLGPIRWSNFLFAPNVEHVVLSHNRMDTIEHITSNFPAIRRLSISALPRASQIEQGLAAGTASLPQLPLIRRLDIHQCPSIYAILRLVTRHIDRLPALTEVHIYRSARLDVESIALINALLHAGPNVMVWCDSQTLSSSRRWRGWDHLPALFEGRVHQLMEPVIPLWAEDL
ncbi:hypothetical protein DL93DRAFT_1212011 [Clavulina sp. PMI_390]|nr:hypothetical protein DL93DRAFT_1212011 [Clavulina sp. PMI_390]